MNTILSLATKAADSADHAYARLVVQHDGALACSSLTEIDTRLRVAREESQLIKRLHLEADIWALAAEHYNDPDADDIREQADRIYIHMQAADDLCDDIAARDQELYEATR